MARKNGYASPSSTSYQSELNASARRTCVTAVRSGRVKSSTQPWSSRTVHNRRPFERSFIRGASVHHDHGTIVLHDHIPSVFTSAHAQRVEMPSGSLNRHTVGVAPGVLKTDGFSRAVNSLHRSDFLACVRAAAFGVHR
jgi:hypothetical protein